MERLRRQKSLIQEKLALYAPHKTGHSFSAFDMFLVDRQNAQRWKAAPCGIDNRTTNPVPNTDVPLPRRCEGTSDQANIPAYTPGKVAAIRSQWLIRANHVRAPSAIKNPMMLSQISLRTVHIIKNFQLTRL